MFEALADGIYKVFRTLRGDEEQVAVVARRQHREKGLALYHLTGFPVNVANRVAGKVQELLLASRTHVGKDGGRRDIPFCDKLIYYIL